MTNRTATRRASRGSARSLCPLTVRGTALRCICGPMPRLTGFAPVSVRGPKALPLIGVQVNALRLLADPIGRMSALHRDHGDVAAIADRSPALVCAFGAERNREVLSNLAMFEHDDQVFVAAAPGSALRTLSRGLVFQTGESHRRHRRLLMPAFQRSAIDGYAPDIVAVAAAALGTWPIGHVADLAALTRELIQRVAMRCLFGLDEGAGASEVGRATAELVDLMTSPLAVALPFDIPGTPHARLLRSAERTNALLRELLAEKRRRLAGADDAFALIVRAGEAEASPLSDEELVGEALTLFFAGHDTQARTLAWTLFLLEQHPDVLADVVDEIDAVLGGGPPTLERASELALVDRVLKESMRVLTPAPVTFVRVCQTEARIGPHALPRGASVILSPFITHRDPGRYPEPTRFLPRRWERIQPTPYEYLPFGAGPRMCIGASFANLAMRLVLPMILQRFRVTLAPGARVSRVVRGNILSPRYGLPMHIAPQDRRFARGARPRGDIGELVELS